MNSSTRSRIQLVAAVALLAVGYGVGRFSSPPPTAKPEPGVASASRAHEATSTALPSRTDVTGNGSADVGGDWNATWIRLVAHPRSPATDAAAGAALQTLAASDPSRALALVLKERNRPRRTEWVHAVLRGWAAVAPEDAARWIATLPSTEIEGAEGAVMDGASRNTDAVVALAQRLGRDDPAGGRAHANQLLRVLSHNGDFETGVDFASNLPEQIRPEMLGTAFNYWAQAQPERAFDAAAKFPAGDARTIALDAAISGWAQGDPAGLAESAMNLSSAEDRAEVLQTALREWVLLNPKAASGWIDQFDPRPELDAGAAAVALQPDVLARQPEIAASWAESITSLELRSNTLASVLREWATKDAARALNYALNSTALQPVDRAALISEINTPPSQ